MHHEEHFANMHKYLGDIESLRHDERVQGVNGSWLIANLVYQNNAKRL